MKYTTSLIHLVERLMLEVEQAQKNLDEIQTEAPNKIGLMGRIAVGFDHDPKTQIGEIYWDKEMECWIFEDRSIHFLTKNQDIINHESNDQPERTGSDGTDPRECR
jgi:hypothetical protein